MGFRFFTIPIRDCGPAESELNAFLGTHKILAVDRRWVDQGASSFWCFCVDYLEKATTAGGPNGSAMRGKIDYKEVLKPEDFAVFARLREWRKSVSQHEAVPVYTVFTNDQLAQMVQARVTTKAALEKIAGIGGARIEKYGAKILELLLKAWPEHEASGTPV